MVQKLCGWVSGWVSGGVSRWESRNISLRARPTNTLTYPWPRTIRGSPTRRSSLNPKIIIFWEKNRDLQDQHTAVHRSKLNCLSTDVLLDTECLLFFINMLLFSNIHNTCHRFKINFDVYFFSEVDRFSSETVEISRYMQNFKNIWVTEFPYFPYNSS